MRDEVFPKLAGRGVFKALTRELHALWRWLVAAFWSIERVSDEGFGIDSINTKPSQPISLD